MRLILIQIQIVSVDPKSSDPKSLSLLFKHQGIMLPHMKSSPPKNFLNTESIQHYTTQKEPRPQKGEKDG